MKHLKNLLSDESGVTAIEYGLIAAIIAVGIILVLNTTSDSLDNTFNSVSSELNSQSGS